MVNVCIREGNGSPLQYSCLENPMDRGAWWATVHGVIESWSRLSDQTTTNMCVHTQWNTAAAAKSLPSCPTLCNPIDGSPPGSLVPGILQARTLEWVAISFSNAWKWKVKVKPFSRVRPSATPRTAAHQAPPSMGFSRQEYYSAIKNKIFPFEATWLNLENTMPSEINQTQTNTVFITYMWNLKK